MPFEPLKIEDLQIGHYVKLECSWWKHPFATNTFKVTTRDELRRIKKISNLKLFFDPDRSDLLPDPGEEELSDSAPPTTVSNLGSSAESEGVSVDQKEQSECEKPNEEQPRFSPDDREPRRQALRERRAQLQRTERAYKETAKQTKVALKNMASGDVSGLRMAEHMLSDLTRTLKTDQSVMALLEVMNNSEIDDPLFVHAMNVCVLSILVGQVMNVDEKELIALGIGALAHDIGYLNIPREVRLTTAGFAREGVNLKLHIQQGLQGIQNIPDFPEAGAKIIAQHHERLNGKGYPDGLAQDEISLLAKIVMIVDEYDELCNSQDSIQGLTPYEALSLMYQNSAVKKKCDFDEDILIQLIKTLGIYPPGTLVELNDGTLGVVISINPKFRTNPQVMIYAPDVPQDEAAIIDLSQDENLSIERSLRPNELSKEAKKYLSPNRMTRFFPSTTDTSVFDQQKRAVS